jgi:outer membrane protein
MRYCARLHSISTSKLTSVVREKATANHSRIATVRELPGDGGRNREQYYAADWSQTAHDHNISGVTMAGGAVQASEPPATSGLYIDLGLAGLLFDTNASINAAGSSLPDSNLHASNNVTLGLGIGYFLTPNISLMAVLGVPPTTTLTGQGTLSGLTLGKVTYGPSMLVANYHFRQLGAFQPFLGTGITYTVVFGTKDDAIANLRVNNSIGAVIRAGFDVMFSDRWGAFLSVSKVFVSTNTSGNAATLGGVPVSAHVSFNPLVLFSGITYRF